MRNTSTLTDMGWAQLQAQLQSYTNHKHTLPAPPSPATLLAEVSLADTSIDFAESSAGSSLSAGVSGAGLLESLESTPTASLTYNDRNGARVC